MSDIDIAAVDSLKVLDLNRPIREADIAFKQSSAARTSRHCPRPCSLILPGAVQYLTLANKRALAPGISTWSLV